MGLIAEIHKDLDRSALQLMAEYHGRLRVEAVRLCADDAEADDLVFRTLERVVAKADTYKDDLNLFAWMKSIMENIHKNDRRRPVVRGTTAVEADKLEEYVGADWSTDEEILRNSDCEVLREVLQRMDPKEREILLMRYYDGFSLKEIANVLNMPVSTVGRRVHLAMRLLAGKLGAEFGKAKNPLAVLFAALLGVGSLFGAWKAAETIWPEAFSSAPEEVVAAELPHEGENLAVEQESRRTEQADAQTNEAPVADSSVQVQAQSETSLTQKETQTTQTKAEKGQGMNLKTVKTLAASAVAAIAGTVSGTTYNVPADGDLATVVGAAQSGDEVVIAASKTPYLLESTLTMPAGVTLRGATGDFNDVVVSGGGTVSGAVVINGNCAVSNITFTSFKTYGIRETGSGARYVENCRFTKIIGTGADGQAIEKNSDGVVSRVVVDNCQLGCNGQKGVLYGVKGTFTECVVTNNYVEDAVCTEQMPAFVHLYNSTSAIVFKNSFVGNNDYGAVHGIRVAKGECCGVVRVDLGTLENCVIVGNAIRHNSPQDVGGIWRKGGYVKNCIILENGLGSDDWAHVNGSSYTYCLSTDTETMANSCVEGDWNDIVAKPGELPWLPYGSRAIGAGQGGGDIGRIWTPETLKCAIKQDKRQYTGAATANLIALASAEATFAWTLVSGPATLTPRGKDATLAFDGPGTAVVRVTATTASETATDEITLVSTPATYSVSTAAELEAALDVAQDGAEIVLAAGDYTPTDTLVLRSAVTVRGATGNRSDVTVSGDNARRVFTIDHPGAVVSSLTVKDGSASVAGGVAMETGGTLTNVCITGCKGTAWACNYEGNDWYFTGGGAVGNYNGKVLDCDIAANTRTVYYNGIIAYGQHGALALADRIFVTNNVSTSASANANYRSAPVAITGGGTIRNAFVAYNDINQPGGGTKYQDASGVYVYDGLIENSTIFRNRVHANYLAYGSGVYVAAKGSVVNCLVTENGDADGNLNNYYLVSGATFDHCATVPVPAEGTECVDYSADPLTIYDINAAGYPVPKPETPTVDTGADLDWTVEPTAVDLFGNLRKQGELTDIGAYEKKPSDDALLCELTVTCDAFAAAPYDVTLGAIVSGSRKTGLSYSWSAIRTYLGVVTTNTVVTADPAYVFRDLEKGDWAFSLTVTNDHEPPDAATSGTDGNVLHLSPEVCYVSTTGSHVWPYDTPQIAATNFIDVAAEARGRVIVLPGAYENLPHVTDADGKDFVGIFEHAVTIEGPADPRAATINCAGLGGLKLANGDAKLWGVAFTNFSTSVAQSALTVAAGFASNIVVDAGNNYGRQTANYVNVGPGGALVDSLLTGSKTTDSAGGYVLSCNGGLVKGCTLAENHSDDARMIRLAYNSDVQRPGRMVGCVITNNSSWYAFWECSGAVVIEDCLIEGNSVKGNSSLLALSAGAHLNRCRILRNNVKGSSFIVCAAWNKGTPVRIENCLIAENTLTMKDAYVVIMTANASAEARVLNTTLVNNEGCGVSYGDNIGVKYPSQFYMTNCIVWANFPAGATVATNVIGSAEKPMLAHNCYSEAVEDDSNFNIAQDPQLRTFGRKIYQPKSSSPCVATGDASLWTTNDVDLLGNPRLTKGVTVDMGCFEPVIPGLLLMVK